MAKRSLSGKTIAVIGGCGHVGLPLGVKLALAGADTVLIDTNRAAVDAVNAGRFPFLDKGGESELTGALECDLRATDEPTECRDRDVYVIVTGTPVDEHLNPKISEVENVLAAYREYIREDSLIIMRSTLFPGTSEFLHRKLKEWGIRAGLAFCPERVAQGVALEEIAHLPQLVSAFDEESFQAAYEVFAALSPCIIRLTPLEAEIAKLMTNTWRYLEFSIANQFYSMAESHGLDFYRIYDAMRYRYPRASSYRQPGLAAGPCLFKDTMQLSAFDEQRFFLGHAAMLANEGLATVIVQKAQRVLDTPLCGRTVGLLGMAFKANIDDTRDALSFKVKKILEFKGATVIFNDPHVAGSCHLEKLLEESDVLILGVPHDQYRDLSFDTPIVDVWGLYNRPEVEILPGLEQA